MCQADFFVRAVAVAALLACGLATAAGASGANGNDADMPGEVLVKLRSTAALTPLLNKYSLTLVNRFGARPIYRLKVVGTARVKDVLDRLARDPDVMIAETNPTHRSPEGRKNVAWVIGTPQAYAAQWAPRALRLEAAHQLTTGAGVRVAVLDTGVDRNHPLLAERMMAGFDFVDFDNDPSEVGSAVNLGFGHGTHVAGLVAMVAPQARIMPLRVLDAEGVGNAWVLAEAMLYAIDPDGNPSTDDGAQVINLSLGSLSRTRIMGTIAQIASCQPAVPGDAIGDRSDPGYNDDTTRCQNSVGAVVVAAAGNDASGGIKQYPAAESAYGLVSIAASTASGTLASFSNYGNWIDVAAPGEAITSALPGGGYGTWSGTSMAAPLAAGTAALVRSLHATLPPKDLARRITRASAMLCGTKLRQVDASAALTDLVPTNLACK